MFKFIHAADIHLDSPLYGLERYEGAPVDEIRGATRRAFQNLINLAIDEEVNFVLIAGDLTDGDWKDYNTALFMAKEFRRLKDAGISVFIISGNHDAASQITKSLKMSDNVKTLSTSKAETLFLKELDVAIHGQGFARRAITDDLAAAYPMAKSGCYNIGLLHTSLTGREGHDTYAPCSLSTLMSKGYDYWALGHIHKQELVQDTPRVIYPGNIQGRHIGETGAKGCMLVTVENSGTVTVEHRDLDVLRWMFCQIDASGSSSPDDIMDKFNAALERQMIAANGRLLAVRVALSGACNAHRALSLNPDQWINEIRSAAIDVGNGSVWVEKVRIGTSMLLDLNRIAEDDTPLGNLIELLKKEEPDDDLVSQIRRECDNIRGKIPLQIVKDMEVLDLAPVQLSALLEDARQNLLARIMTTGGQA